MAIDFQTYFKISFSVPTPPHTQIPLLSLAKFTLSLHTSMQKMLSLQYWTEFNHFLMICDALCLVTKSGLNLCGPMDCSLPGPSVHGDSPGKNTGVGCSALLQGLFPTHTSSHDKFLHTSSNILCALVQLCQFCTVHRLHFFLYFNLLECLCFRYFCSQTQIIFF